MKVLMSDGLHKKKDQIIRALTGNSEPKPAKEETDDKKILRNAIIEGGWAVTVFVSAGQVMQFKADPIAWIYGAGSAFLVGFFGYLVKAYKLGDKKED